MFAGLAAAMIEAAAQVEEAFAELGRKVQLSTEAMLDFDWFIWWYVAPQDAWWEQ